MVRTKIKGPAVNRALILGFVLAALMAASLLLTTEPAHAEDFTVTNTSPTGTVDGSLDRAIRDTNDNPGRDTIKFNIPGTGVKTISPQSALPSIIDPVTIDGYSQPGSRPNSRPSGANDAVILIEIDGSNVGSADGLSIRASNVVVRGLAINRYNARSGIFISEGMGSRIEGNFVGTDATGTVDRGNNHDVFISGEAGNSTIGGTTPDKRNLISGSNSTSFGALILRGKGDNKVQGNLIGTKKDGTNPLPNSGSGVEVSSPRNIIGGSAPGTANTIAFNSKQGLKVDDFNPLGSTGNRILSNSIFSNGLLGIDLLTGEDAVEGPTPNDPKDPDSGANTLQNFPIVTSAEKASGGKATIKGKLDSTPNRKFTIRFFSNPSGEDEGKTLLGQKRVTTDRQGKASFSFETNKPVSARVTATATDASGNTSEFSKPRTVSLAPGLG